MKDWKFSLHRGGAHHRLNVSYYIWGGRNWNGRKISLKKWEINKDETQIRKKKKTGDNQPHRTIRGHQHPWMPSRFPMVSHDTIVFLTHLPIFSFDPSLYLQCIFFTIIFFSHRFFYAVASYARSASEKHTAGRWCFITSRTRENREWKTDWKRMYRVETHERRQVVCI